IRTYHRSRGDDARDVCLIPASAHGTTAASAVLAGLRVVVVSCGADGAVDTADLRAKRAAHDGRVAAIMVPYPSTNGVYEETITEVAGLVHEAGGQVYIDGANLNALAGVASPALLGGAVPTSTCTRPSASRTAAAAPEWARSRRRRTSPRSSPPGPARTAASRWPLPRSRARRTGRPESCRSRGRTSP